jgi:F-box and leucine-rich repeat protein 14
LSCDNITDKGLEHLANLTSLERLNLWGCYNITDKDLEHLTNLTSLERINLLCCYNITDKGIEHLANLTSLKELDLAGCENITDKGLEQLEKLRRVNHSLSLGLYLNERNLLNDGTLFQGSNHTPLHNIIASYLLPPDLTIKR